MIKKMQNKCPACNSRSMPNRIICNSIPCPTHGVKDYPHFKSCCVWCEFKWIEYNDESEITSGTAKPDFPKNTTDKPEKSLWTRFVEALIERIKPNPTVIEEPEPFLHESYTWKND